MNKDYVMSKTIFQTITGSRLYGTNIEGSDTDTKGICIVDKQHYTGFLGKFDQWQDANVDTEIYDIRKAFLLMAKANPNMLDLLFAPRKFWQISSPIWEQIYSHRYEFLSSKVKFTFSGYAIAQLKRIETHRRWLLNPVTVKPVRNFKCPVTKDLIKALVSLPSNLMIPGVKDDIAREQAYQAKLKDYNNYQSWKKTRNKDRAMLETKRGYDLKHGLHLYRLLCMGKEILTTGEVHVDRRNIDAKTLLAIRNGDWSYDKLVGRAKEMDNELDELYEKSFLPKKPNMKKLNNLCCDLTESYWALNKEPKKVTEFDYKAVLNKDFAPAPSNRRTCTNCAGTGYKHFSTLSRTLCTECKGLGTIPCTHPNMAKNETIKDCPDCGAVGIGTV